MDVFFFFPETQSTPLIDETIPFLDPRILKDVINFYSEKYLSHFSICGLKAFMCIYMYYKNIPLNSDEYMYLLLHKESMSAKCITP